MPGFSGKIHKKMKIIGIVPENSLAGPISGGLNILIL